MQDVLAQHDVGVAWSGDQEVGEAFLAECPDAAFRDRVRAGCPDRDADDTDVGRELKQFDDTRGGHFFHRVHFAITPEHGDPGLADLQSAFAPLGERLGMRCTLREATARTRVLIMVSKFAHSLNDLLFRSRIGELPAEIVAVVSNHPDHRALVEWNGIPFFHVPVTAAGKPRAEATLLELVDRFDVELVVLARYM